MYDLTGFTLSDMIACSSALRNLSAGAASMEEVGQRIVRYLYEHLGNKQTVQKSCALVRFYKTHPYGELPPELQAFARATLGEQTPSPTMKCLTLLATAGEKFEWTSRTLSVGHQAIPLPSENVVSQLPMISQLIIQFGLEVSALIQPDPALLVDLEQRTYNVFHVPDAVGSPHIPAQQGFVIPFGIQSALGFGGMLPTGDLFAVILFSKVHVPRATAEMFKTLALSVKVAVVPFVGGVVFA